MRRCVNCEYWDLRHSRFKEMYGSMAEGKCRRYPQKVSTFAKDWCGEFKCVENPEWFEEDED